MIDPDSDSIFVLVTIHVKEWNDIGSFQDAMTTTHVAFRMA